MGKHTPLTSAERTAKHRAKMRAQGFKLKQFWLPDTSSPEFIKEARRQSRLIANSKHEAEDQAYIDAISCWNDLPPP